jgi:hypothetical protein
MREEKKIKEDKQKEKEQEESCIGRLHWFDVVVSTDHIG